MLAFAISTRLSINRQHGARHLHTAANATAIPSNTAGSHSVLEAGDVGGHATRLVGCIGCHRCSHTAGGLCVGRPSMHPAGRLVRHRFSVTSQPTTETTCYALVTCSIEPTAVRPWVVRWPTITKLGAAGNFSRPHDQKSTRTHLLVQP